MAGFAPRTLRATKRLYRALVHDEELDEAALLTSCYESEDFHEGVEAFFAKRRANWSDR
jgi:enoyl-CoA hydratase